MSLWYVWTEWENTPVELEPQKWWEVTGRLSVCGCFVLLQLWRLRRLDMKTCANFDSYSDQEKSWPICYVISSGKMVKTYPGHYIWFTYKIDSTFRNIRLTLSMPTVYWGSKIEAERNRRHYWLKEWPSWRGGGLDLLEKKKPKKKKSRRQIKNPTYSSSAGKHQRVWVIQNHWKAVEPLSESDLPGITGAGSCCWSASSMAFFSILLRPMGLALLGLVRG